MTSTLRILSPGPSTTIQDLGRPGYQRLGVSVGGALDPVALRAANALVGNPGNTGALEAFYIGPSFAVDAADARLSFVGADATIEIFADANATRAEVIPPMRSVRVRRGQVIRVGSLKNAATLYIAVEGGFDIVSVLGSISTDSRGRTGGWQARALVEGDVLPLRRAMASEGSEYRLDGLDLAARRCVRVVLGPQSDYFSEEESASFCAAEYTISAGSNRMGMRLEGRPIRHRRGFNIVSDAVAAGSIQIPGNGQPIVLLADRQTTGGYPKIATVISADLPAIGRLPIGSKISFATVTLEEAVAARGKLHAVIDEIGDGLVRLSPSDAAIASRLLECNLISGIYDAAA